MIRTLFSDFAFRRFLKISLEDVIHEHLDKHAYPSGNKVTVIVCIAYNNPALIELQFKLIQKHVQGSYRYVVADNSPNEDARLRIQTYCHAHGIAYISLPQNPYKMGSQSHAAAISWVIRNYLMFKKPVHFGFIDHDIFPISSWSADAYLAEQPVYGHLQERGATWYLWAGFCFYKTAEVNLQEMNFMPCLIDGNWLDTGGSNWKGIYSRMDRNRLLFPAHSYKQLREGNVPQSDQVELIGEWLHSFNGSYWMKVKEKEHLLEAFLQPYL